MFCCFSFLPILYKADCEKNHFQFYSIGINIGLRRFIVIPKILVYCSTCLPGTSIYCTTGSLKKRIEGLSFVKGAPVFKA